jgi:hypothetical protein
MKTAGYIYITSFSHSGSTVLELLLGGHPRIAAMGEIDRLSLQFSRAQRTDKPGVCSCKQPPGECPVWSQVAEAVKREHQVDLLTEPFRWRLSNIGPEKDLKWRAPWHRIARECYRALRYAKYYHLPVLKWLSGLSLTHRTWAGRRFFVAGVIRTLTHADAVIDSSKDCIAMRDVYDYGTGSVKIIFLTRNVHGAVWSHVRRMKAHRNVKKMARKWVTVNQRILRCLEGVPSDDWIHVTYEELCAHPTETLKKLCGFLGYPYDAAMERLDGVVFHTIAGNSLRLSNVSGVKEDVAWRQNLTPEEIAQIDRIAGPMAVRLGYGASAQATFQHAGAVR